MQTKIKKVTAALVTEEGVNQYATDAALLGFFADGGPGEIPDSLETDLGNGRQLKFSGWDSATASYKQPHWPGLAMPITLRVLNAAYTAHKRAEQDRRPLSAARSTPTVTKTTLSIAELEALYAAWRAENNLPDLGSADEAQADPRVNDSQRMWLRLFCTAWEGAPEIEWRESCPRADDPFPGEIE